MRPAPLASCASPSFSKSLSVVTATTPSFCVSKRPAEASPSRAASSTASRRIAAEFFGPCWAPAFCRCARRPAGSSQSQAIEDGGRRPVLRQEQLLAGQLPGANGSPVQAGALSKERGRRCALPAVLSPHQRPTRVFFTLTSFYRPCRMPSRRLALCA